MTVLDCNSGDDNSRVGHTEKNVKRQSGSRLQRLSRLEDTWIAQRGDVAVIEVWVIIAGTLIMGSSGVASIDKKRRPFGPVSVQEQVMESAYTVKKRYFNSAPFYRFTGLTCTDMSWRTILEDWSEYDAYKASRGMHKSQFLPDDPWEVSFLTRKIRDEYPELEDEQTIQLAILSCAQMISNPRHRIVLVQCVLKQIGVL